MRELLHTMTIEVGPDFCFEVSRVQPVIHTATGTVMAWRYRLAVRLGPATGFDDLSLDLSPELRKSLTVWTFAELQSLFAAAVRTSARIQDLIKIVQFRRDFTVIEDFDLRQLQGAPPHEHLTSP